MYHRNQEVRMIWDYFSKIIRSIPKMFNNHWKSSEYYGRPSEFFSTKIDQVCLNSTENLEYFSRLPINIERISKVIKVIPKISKCFVISWNMWLSIFIYSFILQIHDVPSDPRGAGRCAFANRDIERGEIVAEYQGEHVSLAEAATREENYAREGKICALMVIESEGRQIA